MSGVGRFDLREVIRGICRRVPADLFNHAGFDPIVMMFAANLATRSLRSGTADVASGCSPARVPGIARHGRCGVLPWIHSELAARRDDSVTHLNFLRSKQRANNGKETSRSFAICVRTQPGAFWN